MAAWRLTAALSAVVLAVTPVVAQGGEYAACVRNSARCHRRSLPGLLHGLTIPPFTDFLWYPSLVINPNHGAPTHTVCDTTNVTVRPQHGWPTHATTPLGRCTCRHTTHQCRWCAPRAATQMATMTLNVRMEEATPAHVLGATCPAPQGAAIYLKHKQIAPWRP